MADKRTDIAAREERLTRPESFRDIGSPFSMLERFADEMDRVLDDFGFGRTWLTPRIAGSRVRSPWSRFATEWDSWNPAVDVFQRNNELVVRADLPGLTKDDIKVDVTNDVITIQGERKREHEGEEGGVYRAERTYGSFSRVIPVPEGVIADQAKATFKDGVLEITMPAPPEQVRRGRRLQITEEAPAKK